MGKVKKIKGGAYDMFVSEDGKLVTTHNIRNGVYVYDIETAKPVLSVKTVSNVSLSVVSPDKKILAAKNTSGHLALISMETGEEICRNKMSDHEGYMMTFTEDSKYVIDFDWQGRTMLLDTENNFKILDDIIPGEYSYPPYAYLHYDRYSRSIYKLVDRGRGFKTAVAMISPADKDNISYNVIKEFKGAAPSHLKGISFCKEHIYYLDLNNRQIVVADKEFNEVNRIKMPFKGDEIYNHFGQMWVSPCEKYVYFYLYGSMSGLFDLESMKLIKEFGYFNVTDFKMVNEDTRFIISTWYESYIEEI